jgi:PAS domain-containing protein
MPCPAILLTFDALHEAAVLLDANGNVLHGNRAAEQLFGWNVKPSTAVAAAASASPGTRVVSSMLSLPPAPVDHPSHAVVAAVPSANGADHDGDHGLARLARQRSSSVVSSTSEASSSGPAGAGTGAGPALPQASPTMSGGQPNLTFNPETQQASWGDILASLRDGKICQRHGVGYRLEPAASGDHEEPCRISFPVSVNLLKMNDGAYAAPVSRPDAEQAPELHGVDVDGGDPYVCVFVRELPHAADEWSRQHRAMSANYDDIDAEVAMEAMKVSDNGDSDPAPVEEAERALPDPIDLQQKQMLTASAIIEASIDPMFCINERGIIIMVNEAAIQSFGYSRKEFISANIQMIVGGGHAKVRQMDIVQMALT